MNEGIHIFTDLLVTWQLLIRVWCLVHFVLLSLFTTLKMLSGELYNCVDAELQADHARAVDAANKYNASSPDVAAKEERTRLFKDLIPNQGTGCYFEPPFRCDYGIHIELGARSYRNPEEFGSRYFLK